MDNKIIVIEKNDNELPISLLNYITSESEASRNNETSRLRLYEQWLVSNQMDGITKFDLALYKNYLMSNQRATDNLSALSRTSAAAHINSIRARYLYMLDKAPSKLRDYLYSKVSESHSPADRKAYVDEMQLRIRERVLDNRATVQLIQRTDDTDGRFIRLAFSDMLNYCEAPLNTKQLNEITGVRDSAILTLLCMTGLRESELVNLDVDDVFQKLNGYPALEIRRGKGAKQRVVPYGEFYDYIICTKQCITWCKYSAHAYNYRQ